MKRLLLLLSVVAIGLVGAGVYVSSAKALAFDETLCPVGFNDPNNGEVHVCPQGMVNQHYSVQINGRAGTGCVPYVTFSTSGSLPPGLSMNSSGLISGTPTQAGTFQFWINMADISAQNGGIFWCTDNEVASRVFQITIQTALSIEQQSLAPTIVNSPYSFQLTASGGGTQTWSLNSGTLPPGITLSTGGLLSGTPTATGSYTFVVKVADSGSTRTDTETLTLNVLEPLTATAPTPAPNAEVSASYELDLTAAGGTGPYAFAVTQGTLPDGLTLDPATGKITGVPTTAGPSSVVVTVTDQNHFTTALPLAINVKAKLTIVTKTLKTARVRSLYRAKIQTLGGYAPFRYGVSGTLPPGIHFNPTTAAFVGNPRKAGTYQVTLRVTDSLSVTSKQTLVFKVLKAKPKPKR